MKYNKLIRDKIPDIIKSKGDDCKVHVAREEEYWNKLRLKLDEEVEEFLENPCSEELGDILEVINAIADFKFEGKDNLEKIREMKSLEKGGFEKRFILDEVED
ncbi:MAG: nucleoside triphosphate pyrophosphohydrolase [Nanoarchaeota archaeon]|nr:nucleoside triphosphate pyrophosphohydrolase [Nanoarchaeota archaeon]